MGRKRRGVLSVSQEREFFPPLDLVVTPAEVCERWGKSKKAVMARLWAGDFVARKSGRTWLIAIRSVIYWWGSPTGEQDSE